MGTEVRGVHRLATETNVILDQKLALAELAKPFLPPFAQNLVELLARYRRGRATRSELREARTEAWTYLGSLACYCSETDALGAQFTLIAVDDAKNDRPALAEMIDLLSRMGVSDAALREALEGAKP